MWLIFLLLFPNVVLAEMIEVHKELVCSKDPITCSDELLTSLGNSPGFKLKADSPTDTVNGSVSVKFCNPILIDSEAKVAFRNGQIKEATLENIAAWLTEQGHRVERIDGNMVYCDSIIRVELYEKDRMSDGRGTVKIRKPLVRPSTDEIKTRITIHADKLKGDK